MNKVAAIGVVLFALPMPAFAAVSITEIMYDASGSDSGREWVEFTNTGSTSIDASGFKFFEANTNHGISVLSGSGVLVPGASAVIVEDQAKFMADNASFVGTLFKSSFSLGNTGETIAIKDSALAVLSSATYDSSMGAAGDGNSLQWNGSTFVPGAPTPGSYGGSLSANDSAPASTTVTQTTQTQAALASGGPPAVSAYIDAAQESMVGGGEFFDCRVFSSTGTPLSPARCLWNFGDGMVGEGARVFHAYEYPGTYEVVLSAAYNYSSATARMAAAAVPAAVGLVAEGDGSLSVVNNSSDDLDIGLWSLVEGSGTPFVIPAQTLVLKGHEVRFAPLVLGFAGDTAATLRYPNNALAASAAVGTQSPLRGQTIAIAAAPGPSQKSSGLPSSGALRATSAGQTPAQGSPPTQKSTLAAASAEADAPIASDVAWSYYLALTAVVAIGAVGAYYARIPSAVPETELTADEFDIE